MTNKMMNAKFLQVYGVGVRIDRWEIRARTLASLKATQGATKSKGGFFNRELRSVILVKISLSG